MQVGPRGFYRYLGGQAPISQQSNMPIRTPNVGISMPNVGPINSYQPPRIAPPTQSIQGVSNIGGSSMNFQQRSVIERMINDKRRDIARLQEELSVLEFSLTSSSQTSVQPPTNQHVQLPVNRVLAVPKPNNVPVIQSSSDSFEEDNDEENDEENDEDEDEDEDNETITMEGSNVVQPTINNFSAPNLPSSNFSGLNIPSLPKPLSNVNLPGVTSPKPLLPTVPISSPKVNLPTVPIGLPNISSPKVTLPSLPMGLPNNNNN
jgi:hypothetical protein